MHVKMLAHTAGHNAGDTCELPDALAKELVAKKQAVECPVPLSHKEQAEKDAAEKKAKAEAAEKAAKVKVEKAEAK